MSEQSDGAGQSERDAIHGIVRQAEELSYSSDWRDTARAMRNLRRAFQTFQLPDGDPLSVRFRIAQQIFMDRRADFFSRGNRDKGAKLQNELAVLRQKAGELRESIQYCHATLRGFQEKRAELAEDDNRQIIEGFIEESYRDVSDDIERKTAKLLEVEKEIVILSTRFHSA